jgi:amino acid transporter
VRVRLLQIPKRLFVGAPVRSERLGEAVLPKRIALPIFASSALSTVAYAPQEIFVVLSIGGLTYYHHSLWLAGLVVLLMLTVIMSYRQTVHEYPSGGGDYEVATANLGQNAGITVASALMVDYVLTVAVSVTSGVENLGSAIPYVAEHKVGVGLSMLALFALVNLRGVRESGFAFAVPCYAFIVGILALIAVGLFRALVLDHDMRAPTADYEIAPEVSNLGALALVFLLLRAYASGCAALTGCEAISNGVPAFKKPKGANAAKALAIMGGIAATMLAGMVTLGNLTDVRLANHPQQDILIDGRPAGDSYEQDPIIAQVSAAVLGDGSAGFVFLAIATAFILFLAANTAFNGFPVLGSILARDGFLPRQLHTRGDRLAFSNGIIALAAAAGIMIYAFDARSTGLIQLYIVGVFVSFTLGQAGMVRHWTRQLRGAPDAAARMRMRRSRAVNGTGFVLCGTSLAIILLTKFTHGAYLVVIAMPVLFLLMKGIRRHYDSLAAELTPPPGGVTLPSRIHGVVLVSRLHTPAMRALAFARATRPTTLTALTVQTTPESTAALLREWGERQIPVPLKILDSPYRDVTGPIVDYLRQMRRASPRDVVCIFLPEYVVGRWWEQLLHNQSALRLKARLLFLPGVMVTSVPWQLGSAETREARRQEARSTVFDPAALDGGAELPGADERPAS